MMGMIKTQVSKVIQYSQGFEPKAIDELLNDWRCAKDPFIRMFGDQLIYESSEEISLPLSIDDKAKKFTAFISWLQINYPTLVDLIDFLKKNERGFFDNVVMEPYKGIPKGMKLLKALKHFVPGEMALRAIQDEASILIQQSKIKGIMCLSVHPLDFLSLSENNHNWRSCHALDGEFRAGNLSYMCDRSTIICYIKSKKDNVILNRFPTDVPWNSKKWRMLIHVSENFDMAFASKQYPFTLPGVLSEVNKLLINIPTLKSLVSSPLLSRLGVNQETWTDFVIDDKDLWDYYLKLDGKLVALHTMITEPSPVLQYNDVVRSSTYKPIYAHTFHLSTSEADDYVPHFTIGAAITCPCCGEGFLNDTESMCCYECYLENGGESEYGYCEICGAPLNEDWQEVEDLAICERCYERTTYICPQCGEVIFDENKVYHQGTDTYYCEECYDNIVNRK